MCIYFIFREISNLNGDAIMNEISLSQIKKMTDILVIDDDSFTYLDALKSHEFNIDYKTDLQSLKDVEAYDIILCDVRGVGKFLGSEYEGAYLVKQIKEKYPNKTVISYTANNYDPGFQYFLEYADAIMPKGSSLEDWSALLDEKLRERANPVQQWERTRKELLDAGVSTIKVAKMEDQYVKAIQNKSFESIKKLYENQNTKEAEIMKALLSSAVATILKK